MTFRQFFEAVWNKAPFPWQERLAQLALKGTWPQSIGLPTAAGKTALIDISMFALAMGAPKAARRIFFVVDRRVIVDEAASRAEALADKLCKANPASDLGKVAQALRDLGGGPDPLITAILRGGIPRHNSWKYSPLQPVVICSTVDQVGSGLLFRAYGASEYGRPIRAGLAANDSLIILDEAHTSQPFAETLGWIRKYRDWAERPLDLPFTVVEMSATPRNGEVFGEDDDDLKDTVLKERWEAEKRAKLVTEESKPSEESAKGGFTALVEGLVREARAMRDEHGAKTIGVIANRVLTARRVHEKLAEDPECDAILLTGRARPYDRDQLWDKWGPRIALGRKTDFEKPIFVVATQCIEVGANIDFDALVSEIASIDALEQRFGRLNRDGRKILARAAIVAQKDQTGAKYDDPIYGSAVSATWRWLKDHEIKEERAETLPTEGKKKPKTKKFKEWFVPMGVLALRQALRETTNRAELVMPRRSAPVLMPAHVDLLCQTSPEPAVSPEPALFLHGPETGPADVQVIWRQDFGDETELWSDLAAICPPSAAEAISLPIWAVRKWLSKQVAPDLADIEGSRDEDARARAEGGPVLMWRGSDDSEVFEEPEDIRPGMTIVVPASYGGCDEWGWNPASESEVNDVGDAVKLRMGRPMLRLHPKLVGKWNDPELAGRLSTVESVREARTALNGPVSAQALAWVQRAVLLLRSSRVVKLVDNPDDDASTWAAITGRATFDQESTAASYTTEVRLDVHLEGCEQWAESFGRELPERVRNTVVRAAGLHDIGKADPRFQAWLRGGNPVKPHELIAKSLRSGQNRAAIERARQLAGYPKRGRHELLSTALLEDRREDFADVDFDLLLHLVGSHHGRCRPFAPVVEDGDPVQVLYSGWRARSDHQLESAGSGVCERFWRLTRRYGWYGLAYLEALVRLADHRQSEAEENAEEERGGTAHA
jgi:CRISPR-associated endonuclease/helicase Cas3